MSNWLERELGRELTREAAPDALGIRLGFAPVKCWEVPRLALAVAAAVVLVIGGSYAASRTVARSAFTCNVMPAPPSQRSSRAPDPVSPSAGRMETPAVRRRSSASVRLAA